MDNKLTKITKPKKEEDGEKAKSMSTKPPLTERIMKKAAAIAVVATLAIVPTSCLDWSMKDKDAEVDSGPDADSDVADADTVDSDVIDADLNDSDILDGDIADDADTVADSDVVDGDMTDGDVSDSDVADADGPLCSDIFDEVVTEETFDKGTGREVGGYMITYVSQTTGGLTLDIDCGSDSSSIASGESLTTLVEHTVEVPDDGKRIRITVHSRNTFDATMSVAVEPL